MKETGGKDICDDEIKSAHIMNATKTADFHSTTMKKNTTNHDDNLENWIEYVKRKNTKEADENMLTQRRARAWAALLDKTVVKALET